MTYAVKYILTKNEGDNMNKKQPAKSMEKAKKILNAAKNVLAQKGFSGTTIALVSEEAEVSRGLLHYYFKNKEDMLAKVLRNNMQYSVDLLTDLFNHCDSAEMFADKLVQTLTTLMENDPDYFNLFVEGLAVARYSELVRNELGTLYAEFRKSLHDGIQQMERNGIITVSVPVGGLAAVIAGILDGISVQLVTLSRITSDDELWESLRKMIVLLMKGGRQ